MSELPVEVIRSARRAKTVQAKVVDGRIRVSIPAGFTAAEEKEWVERMTRRLRRRRSSLDIDLVRRAAELAGRLDLPLPASIEWSDRQNTRWGSCTPAARSIRISRRLAETPRWVLDYVIVHELAHLVAARHDDEFHELVDRFPLAERARGYLIAKSESG